MFSKPLHRSCSGLSQKDRDLVALLDLSWKSIMEIWPGNLQSRCCLLVVNFDTTVLALDLLSPCQFLISITTKEKYLIVLYTCIYILHICSI